MPSGEHFRTNSIFCSRVSRSLLDSATSGGFHISATRMEEVRRITHFRKSCCKPSHVSFLRTLFVIDVIVWRSTLCWLSLSGTFLLIYFIAMFACGIPIFFQVTTSHHRLQYHYCHHTSHPRHHHRNVCTYLALLSFCDCSWPLFNSHQLIKTMSRR